MGRVVRDFEGVCTCSTAWRARRLRSCQPGCTLRGVLEESERRQMDYLNSVTLESLLPSS